MKRIYGGLTACALALGCSGAPGQGDSADTGEARQDLDVTQVGNLIKQQGGLTSQDEGIREGDTASYYDAVKVAPDGTGTSVSAAVPDLDSFIGFYGFDPYGTVTAVKDTVAVYYNRGDLGIGREMHCVDDTAVAGKDGEIACYVKNYAAGDDGSEFTFGGSKDIAFTNQANGHQFATVAMVFRKLAAPANRVYFVVYNNQGTKHGNLSDAAALDRGGLLFQNAFAAHSSTVGLGIPGVNFNNHIPSNCVTCHGGAKYDNVAHAETGSLFLPFDLDQFEYNSTFTLSGQQAKFRGLNQMVRNVAFASGSDINSSLRDQLDGWYGNTKHNASFDPTSTFDPNYIPPGWKSGATVGTNVVSALAPGIYQSVVRGSCRNCHVVNATAAGSHHFDDEPSFKLFAGTGVPPGGTGTPGQSTLGDDLANYIMPHSLQSIRTFWQSNQPGLLEAYFRSSTAVGSTNSLSNVADEIHNAGVGKNVTTLDPVLLSAASVR